MSYMIYISSILNNAKGIEESFRKAVGQPEDFIFIGAILTAAILVVAWLITDRKTGGK